MNYSTADAHHPAQPGASYTRRLDEAFLARISTEMPDSPSVSGDGDDWALSSLGGVSDFEDDLSAPSLPATESEPSLVMPRQHMLPHSAYPRVRSVGKLRVLVAGAAGLGKSQLVDTLIEMPEIAAFVRGPGPGGFTEVLARTRPAGSGAHTPSERSGLDMSMLLMSRSFSPAPHVDGYVRGPHARTETADGEYNIAFIDAPGYSSDEAPSEYAAHLTAHLDGKVQETASLLNGLNPGARHILSHAASLRQFPLVDCCLYMLATEGAPSPRDVAVLRELAPYVAVVPVLARSDTVPPNELGERKAEVLRALADAGVASVTLDDAAPHAVSTRHDHNYDMHESAVMAPDYQAQVLVPSDLPALAAGLFSERGARTLRAVAARLFCARVQNMHMRSALHHRLSRPLVVPSQVELDLGWGLHPSAAGGSQGPRRALAPTSAGDAGAATAASNPARGKAANEPPLPPVCWRSWDQDASRRQLSPINNVDPLDLSGWGTVLYRTAVLIVAAVGVHAAVNYSKGAYSPPPPPPPPTWLDYARGLLRWVHTSLTF